MYNEREYQKAYQKKWYEKNKKSHTTRINARRKELREWFFQYKETLKCEMCSEPHISTLEFHHKDPSKKDLEISNAITHGWSKERILMETSKCQVLCANCHRKLHWGMV